MSSTLLTDIDSSLVLKDIWWEYENFGVFYYLQQMNVPWRSKNINANLDKTFMHLNGNKTPSPFLNNYYEYTPGDERVWFTNDSKTAVSTTIFNLFNDNWTAKWNALTAEYDPISNYDMVESGTDTTTRTGTNDVTQTGTDTHSIDHANTQSIESGEVVTSYGTDVTTNTNTDLYNKTNADMYARTNTSITQTKGDDELQISAFNSSSYQDKELNTHGSDTTSGDATNNYTRTQGDATDNYTRTQGDATDNYTHVVGDATSNHETVVDTRVHADNGNTTDEETKNLSTTETRDTTDELTHSLTRSGNIGVTTSQQMIESELKLREYVFFDSVFNDICSVLTLPIYRF